VVSNTTYKLRLLRNITALTVYDFSDNLVSGDQYRIIRRMDKMAKTAFRMSDEAFESFAKKYSCVKRSNVEDSLFKKSACPVKRESQLRTKDC